MKFEIHRAPWSIPWSLLLCFCSLGHCLNNQSKINISWSLSSLIYIFLSSRSRSSKVSWNVSKSPNRMLPRSSPLSIIELKWFLMASASSPDNFYISFCNSDHASPIISNMTWGSLSMPRPGFFLRGTLILFKGRFAVCYICSVI